MSRDDGDALARSHVGEDSSQELHGAARNDEFFDAVLDDETHERRFLRLTSEVCLDVRECRSRYLNTLVFRKAGRGCCRHRASSLLYSQHPQHSQQTQRPFHGTYRYLRIDNTGTVKQGFALTVAGVTNGTDNAWASDPSLRIMVTRCAVAWTQATNSCGNSPATVITTRPVSTASGSFPVQTDVAPSGAMYLQVKLELDANAPNSVQGRSGKVQLTETGTQQAGTQR